LHPVIRLNRHVSTLPTDGTFTDPDDDEHPLCESGVPPKRGGGYFPRSRRRATRCGELGGVNETPEELRRLQRLLDDSAAAAGAHMREIVTDDCRLTAAELCRRLHGMCLLTVATVTADGWPLVGPVDGYLLHGFFYFSSGRSSVKMRHLATRPALSAIHLPGEELAVTVHGRAELFDFADPAGVELRRAMLDWYLPKQGPAFEDWLDHADPVGARIVAEKMFTFAKEP